MSVSDPIADMLTRIRNANMVSKPRVRVKRNKVCVGIARVLKDEGYIQDFVEIEDPVQGEIELDLKYGDGGERIIRKIERVSRPGRRTYSRMQDMPRILDGLGVLIVSTSRGVMSDRQCRQQRLGGELLCKIW